MESPPTPSNEPSKNLSLKPSNRKKITLITIILLILIPMVAFSLYYSFFVTYSPSPQSITPDWVITRGNMTDDESWGVVGDQDGNLFFLTHISNTGSLGLTHTNIHIFKINASSGSEIWNCSWGAALNDNGYDLVYDNDSQTVFVGGRTQNDNSTYSMLILAFSATDGALKWNTTWKKSSGAIYHEVDGLAIDGNDLFAVGWADNDMGILKLDKVTGSILWNVTWGTTGLDKANGKIVINGEFLYVAGSISTFDPLSSDLAVLVKFSKLNGAHMRNVTWHESGGSTSYTGVISDGQSLYCVGTSQFSRGAIHLQKYDLDLNLVWSQKWDGESIEVVRTVALFASNQKLLVAGSSLSWGSGSYDVVLIEFSIDGSLLGSWNWGGAEFDQTHGLTITNTAVYVSGESRSFGNRGTDAFLAKFALSIF